MYLLVEYQEGYSQPAREGHITCSTIEDDYYNPVVICDTKKQLIQWVDHNNNGSIEVNGDTLIVTTLNWQGKIKSYTTYYMVKVELGKAIVY